MSNTTTLAPEAPAVSEAYDAQRDAFAERVLGAVNGAFEVFGIYLGERLGFYRALAGAAALTAPELARRTGTHERYAREWLEHQAVLGILQVPNPQDGPRERRFVLPAPHAEVLTDRDSLNYLAPMARLLVGALTPMESLLDAYRTGGGVPFAAYGADLREGQADVNRTAFLQQLGQEWLPALPDVDARLRRHPPARVADIGCGGGWSAIGMAQAYPQVRVDGFDLDQASVDLARANAREAGLGDRVQFHCRDAADLADGVTYDLVTAFECVHDMSDPVRVLTAMRRLAGDGGTVLVMDERVGEQFDPSPAGDSVEAMMYGWSVFHCLPVGMADAPAAGTGTVMRPDTLRAYARAAGFESVEILPIDHYFFRFYRLG